MSYNPAAGFPRIMPSLRYEDVGTALAWLNQTFGLTEYLRWADEGGVIRHAEMRIDNAFIELSEAPEGYRTPKHLGQRRAHELRRFLHCCRGRLPCPHQRRPACEAGQE